MEQFSIGRVFSRAFSLIRQTAGSVGVFILVLLLIEAVLGMIAQPMMIEQIRSATADSEGTQEERTAALLTVFQSGAYLATVLFGIVSMAMGWAGGIHGMLQHSWRGSVSAGECLTIAIRRFLPVLGLIILWWLAVMFGWVLLFVPAAIMASMWSVAIAAQVGEGLGVFAAFGRSRTLTRGLRLSIFGALVVMIITYYVLAIAVMGPIVGSGILAAATAGPEALTGMTWWMMLIAVPMGWVTGMFLKAMVVSLYLETVLVKEGGRTAELSEVFE